jgi:hypothetical protein
VTHWHLTAILKGRQQMKAYHTLLAATLFACPGMCAPLSFTGTFDDPNQVFLQTFAVISVSEVAIQTWSYGGSAGAPGGTNAAGMIIPSGGFDPLITLYASDGSFVNYNDDGDCPVGSPDGGNCFDSTLVLTSLTPDSYLLALTATANFPLGALGDGFTNTGDFGGRDNTYAVDIAITPDEMAVPEPSSAEYLGLGLLLYVSKLVAMRIK